MGNQSDKTERLGKPLAIDLFSGCGGMTLGLRQAGFKVIGAVDIDPLCVETYRKNHRGVIVWEKDIRRLSAYEIKKTLGIRKGSLDLLVGCPPCQGFSTIRTKNGGKPVRDPAQKDLVFEFLRFVRDLRPRAIMLENVPRLAKDRRMRQLVSELKGLGYRCNYGVLDAANYGVPQRRRRVILLGSLGGKIEFAPPDPDRKTVRETISRLGSAYKSQDELHTVAEKRSKRIQELIKAIPKDGGSRSALSKGQQLECHKNIAGFKDVYGRMAWDEVAPTITGGCINPSKGRFLHPMHNRAITLREAALLQSFPPHYYFSLKHGRYHAAELIGNALPPEFIRRHAVEVLKKLQSASRKEG